jgi:Flp pilus assembly CpaE family ATPase
MLASFARKLLTGSVHSLPLRRCFSTNSQKLQALLGKIQVQDDSGKNKTLLESGLIAGQHIDP